jgi:ribosomal protein S18 acetylase RimI-like enzyme
MTEDAEDSPEFEIRPYEPRFESDLIEICWLTGLMGESLAGTRRFEDRRLFAMIFALPYVRFQPEVCFLALTRDPERAAQGGDGKRAVGYIIGATDTPAQARAFKRREVPRIALRAVFFDSWRHPESFRQLVAFSRAEEEIETAAGEAPRAGAMSPAPQAAKPIWGGPDYPAQLHINLHPDFQGRGLGSRLMDAYLGALRAKGVPGVFLQTSDHNHKALPFYEKRGFKLAESATTEMWAGIPAQALTYTLSLHD